MEIILCPFCSTPWDRKMLDVYNTSYGCETGCTYVRIVIECSKCKRVVYIKGDFGEYENEKEKQELLDEIDDKDLENAAEKKREYDDYNF